MHELSDDTPNGREIRARLQKACAIVHGRGYKMSANDLMELVYEEGLPPRVERERILAEKLAGLQAQRRMAGDNTSLSSPPSD